MAGTAVNLMDFIGRRLDDFFQPGGKVRLIIRMNAALFFADQNGLKLLGAAAKNVSDPIVAVDIALLLGIVNKNDIGASGGNALKIILQASKISAATFFRICCGWGLRRKFQDCSLRKLFLQIQPSDALQ